MKLTARKLDQTEIDDLVQTKLSWILAGCQPQKVLLFGSAANGTMTDCSDIDLILIFDKNANLKEINRALYKQKPAIEWPTDILLYTQDSFDLSVSKGGGVCWLAQKEGKVIFERK